MWQKGARSIAEVDPIVCSGHGSSVNQRCVCHTRFVGSQCQKEISWLAYYGSLVNLI